jgi:hypothetical protein
LVSGCVEAPSDYPEKEYGGKKKQDECSVARGLHLSEQLF